MQVPQQIKDCLLKLLDKVVAVCDEHGLRYYLAGGSVLGAIRHKGFIPWDDDIDIYLFREDYEKIQKLPTSVWGDEFRLAFYTNTPNYTYDFIKIELTNTSVIERYHPNYHGGVFLDIFPLDFVPNDLEKRQQQLSKVKPLTKDYVDAFIKNDCDCSSLWEVIALKLLRLRNRDKHVLYQWEEIVGLKNVAELNDIVDFHSPWMHRPMPFEYISDGVEVEFEGKYYRVPSNYDAYLKHVYGDYMQLPPVEKRVGHSFDFVNYDRRLSSEEVKDVFKEMHKKYSYKFSVRREIKNIIRFLKNIF